MLRIYSAQFGLEARPSSRLGVRLRALRSAWVGALQLMEPKLHAKFQHNRSSRYRVTAGGTFVTPLKRHAPRAIVTVVLIVAIVSGHSHVTILVSLIVYKLGLPSKEYHPSIERTVPDI